MRAFEAMAESEEAAVVHMPAKEQESASVEAPRENGLPVPVTKQNGIEDNKSVQWRDRVGHDIATVLEFEGRCGGGVTAMRVTVCVAARRANLY